MSDLFSSPAEVYKAYADGLKGYVENARAKFQFLETQKYQYFNEPNIKGSGRGKRIFLWDLARRLDKRCYTEVQTTGDCVSQGSRNARDATRAARILVNREPFGWFQVGATEPTYGSRGHGGEGMAPAEASTFERDVGFLVRTKYDAVDLTNYDSRIGSRWGSSGVPEAVKSLCRQHKVGVITNVRSQEDLMDALINGYGAHSGQYAAWEPGSNKHGIHGRAIGGWHHDMATLGYDDTLEFFPFRVFTIQNSWGGWNQKPKAWPKEYPEWQPGLILTSADDYDVCVSSGDCWVYGHVDGFPPQRIPDLGSIGLLSA